MLFEKARWCSESTYSDDVCRVVSCHGSIVMSMEICEYNIATDNRIDGGGKD